ncbi:MAG TPA: ABC transporter permease, partial [Stellaceae bacterium]|nr:ABC transporter permease [Stellaceae bacterium]
MSSASPIDTHAVPDDDRALRRSIWQKIASFCVREPMGTFGLFLVLLIAFAAVSADWLAPYDPTSNDFGAMTEPPSWDHLLGTDPFGRDVFSRILFGAQTAMIVGFACALIGGLVGLVIGVASAYFGGWFDLVLQRVLDVLMAFPLIILALAVVAIFGTGVENVIIAITIPLIPRCARIVRASALAIREVPYVDAARACGFGHWRIIM